MLLGRWSLTSNRGKKSHGLVRINTDSGQNNMKNSPFQVHHINQNHWYMVSIIVRTYHFPIVTEYLLHD